MKDKRIKEIIHGLTSIAAGDFNKRLPISEKLDEVDGISSGINMLTEKIDDLLSEEHKRRDELQETVKQLEAATNRLEHSEKLFEKVFHTSPDIITLARFDDGIFVEVNQSFLRVSGFSKKEILGASVFDLDMWVDPGIREYLKNEVKDGGIAKNVECRFRVKDGTIMTGLLSATLIKIDDVPHLLTVSRDITELKKAEEELRHSRERYADLISLAPNGIVVLDNKGFIRMVNPAFSRISGYTEKDLLNKHFSKYKGFKAKDIPKFIRIFNKVLSGKDPGPVEIQWYRKDGTLRFADIHVSQLHQDKKVTGIQAILSDTTEKHKTLQALKSSEQQYRSVINSMIDSVYVINRDFEVILVNDSLKRELKKLGLTPDIVGKKYTEAFPFLQSSTLNEYKKVFRTGKNIQKEEKYQMAGEILYTNTRLIAIADNGQINRIMTVVQDVTEQKKAEHVQQIMYQISSSVNLTKDLRELIHVIRDELGKIFDTTNFFIALYNKDDDTLSLPFFVDEKDSFEAFPAKKSLTGYVIRNDKPLLMKNKDIENLVKEGIVDNVGTPSKIWLGVPLKIKEEIFGALVVQHYENEDAYDEQDLEILKFVSTQIGFSIETKRAHDETQVEKAYFEQLFHNSPETIVLMDQNGIILRVNHAFEELFGFSAEEATGRNIDELIVPDQYRSEGISIRDRTREGNTVRVETERRHKNGRLIDVSILGTPIKTETGLLALYGIYRDITERKRNEKALKESEEKLRNILYSSPDAITVSDLNGKVTECNPASLKIFGLKNTEDIVGINAINFVVPSYRRKGMVALNRVLKKGHVNNVEFELIRPDRQRFNVGVSASLMKDMYGRPTGIVAITKDITERKQFEENLKIAKEKAEESDKLKSAFLANMSHEIRTPMNAILGFAELLKNDELSKKERNEFINIISNKGNELLHIINDIIDISKIEAGDISINKKDVGLNEFFRILYQEFAEEKLLLNREHIDFRLSLPPDTEAVLFTDRNRLRQIMVNLINNAFKFTHEGFIKIGYELTDNQSVRMFVKDTGIGISEEKQAIVFDRFRQVDESVNAEFGGTGLGLAISENLIQLLGGKIWVSSKPEHGSVFYLSHPCKELIKQKKQDAGTEELTEASMAKIDLSTKKILVAEDDSANYLFLESFLKQTNAQVIWARDGQQVLDLINNGESVNLILMDIRMPVMNGISATEQIKRSKPQIPVIALTAHAFANDRDLALDAGCNDYLIKPVKLEDLYRILRKYLND